MKAGVIGLGQIGGGVALCLARAGLLSGTYDVRGDAARDLDGVPPVAESPAAVAARADVIVIAVVDMPQTLTVLSGPDGVLSGARAGQSIILLATLSLDDLADVRRLTDAAGVALIDSGVVGGRKAGENGLICLVGAEREDLARVMPVFDGFARYVAHLGGPGAGMAGKIIFNGIFHAALRAGLEGSWLAKAAGVDLHQLARVFADSGESVGGPLLFATMAGDPLTDPEAARDRRYRSTIMAKDLDAALALATANGFEVPMIAFTRETLLSVVGVE